MAEFDDIDATANAAPPSDGDDADVADSYGTGSAPAPAGDDFFGGFLGDTAGDHPADDVFSWGVPSSGNHGALDDMMAGPDEEDDIVASPADPARQPAPVPEKPSALIEWEERKNAELAQKDKADEAFAAETKSAASQTLRDWHDKLRSVQAKRFQHNQEADEAKLRDLAQDVPNRWEKVAKFIDFTGAALHVRDVSRMRLLLFQLKQSDRK
jgi:hypothetical protein